MSSGRNVPQRFAGAVGNLPPKEGPRAEFIKALRQRINNGIDPLYVGELVCEAIENDWPYIFTDTEHAMEPRRRDRRSQSTHSIPAE